MTTVEINNLITVLKNYLTKYSILVANSYRYLGKTCKENLDILCKYYSYQIELENYKETDLEYATLVAEYLLINTEINKNFNKLNSTVVINSNMYIGGANTVLTLEAEILALTLIEITSVPKVIDYTTGTTNKNHIFAIENDRELISVIDTNAAYQNLLPFFIESSIVINSKNYKLYKMENGVPYTASHLFKITIQ